MTREQVLELCGRFPGALEDYPFGDGVAVFKVAGRMFALVSLDGNPGSVNLKCDPGLALELRAVYAAVRPGYHQNKRHWNTVELDGSIDDGANTPPRARARQAAYERMAQAASPGAERSVDRDAGLEL